jgi:uncharacterized phage protein (TIGR01671 family)
MSIYEGDIVRWHENMNGFHMDFEEEIKTLKDAYQFEGSSETETWEVIGNIYENPNLLQIET